MWGEEGVDLAPDVVGLGKAVKEEERGERTGRVGVEGVDRDGWVEGGRDVDGDGGGE